MNIKAIFFDLDDTLYDQQKPFTDTVQGILPAIIQEIPIDDLYKRTRHYSDLFWKEYCCGELSLDQLRIQRIRLALKDYDFDISKEEACRFQYGYEQALESIKPFPEVPELLGTLQRLGLKIGIITNGPIQHQRKKIDVLGLSQVISRDDVLISDEIGFAKPSLEIFHEACRRASMPPHHLLYIGDSWTNDVIAPMEAGWHSVWFNYRKRLPQSEHQPLMEIDHLLALLGILK